MPDEIELSGQIERLEAMLQENPDSEHFAELAELLVSAKRSNEAIRICERGLGYHPSKAEGHLAYGMALIASDSRDEGLQAIERACTLKRNDVELLAKIGNFLVDTNWPEAAHPYLEKALEIAPEDQRLMRLKVRLGAEPIDDVPVETEPISIDRDLLSSVRGSSDAEEAKGEQDEVESKPWQSSTPAEENGGAPGADEESKWPSWDSHPPPPTDAFATSDDEDDLPSLEDSEEEDEPPTVYEQNPLASQQETDAPGDVGDSKDQEPVPQGQDAGPEAVEEDEARIDQETRMDPSAGLRAEIDDAMDKAVQQQGEPPTMFDPGASQAQPWAKEQSGPKDPSVGEPPTVFEGQKEASAPEPPPTRYSPEPGGAVTPFREAIAAPAETFSYLKVFLVLVPFLVAGLVLGGYFAYRHIRVDKINNLISQAEASMSLDTFLGYSDARMTLDKLLELDEENPTGRALLALSNARLNDEYGPNLGLAEEARRLVTELEAVSDAPEDLAVILLWTRIHLGNGEGLDERIEARARNASDPQTLFLAGEWSFKHGESEEAVKFLEAGLAKEPSNIRAHFLLARLALDAGKEKRARKRLERALAINGIHVRSLLLFSKIRVAAEKELERAEVDLKKLVELPRVTDKRRAEAHFLLARIAFGKLERSEAVTKVKAASELMPEEPDFLARLARLCAEYYELNEAQALAEKVLEVKPDDMQMRLVLIGTYLPRQRVNKAMTELDKLVGKRVPAAPFLTLRGEALLALGRFSESINDLNSVPKGAKERLRARTLAALATIKRNDLDEAYRSIKEIRRANQDYALVYYVAGQYRLSKRQYRSARASFEKAVELDRLCYPAFVELARMEYKGRNNKQALHFTKKALKANPHAVDAWHLVGRIKLEDGEPSVALQAYIRVVTEDVQDSEGFVGMAEALMAQNDTEKAYKAIRKGFKAGAEDAHAYHVQGRIFLAMAKFFKAVHALKKADRLDEKNPEILADLGLAQLGIRSISRAEKSFKESLKRRRLPRAQEGYAKVMLQRRDYDKAARAFEIAAVWGHRKGWSPKEVARLYVEGGHAWIKEGGSRKNLARARRMYRKAMKQADQDPGPVYFLATAYDRDNKLSLARKTYLQVLDMDKNHSMALYRLGLIEYDQKNDEKAKEYLERFLKTGYKGSERRRARQIFRKLK